MSKILKIRARQVFDSRGNPTIEAEVYSKSLSSSAICPSGASTGTYEAFEKRDKNNKKYLGKSVLTAVNLINTKISKKLKGFNVHDQERIDAILINLDGTRQKTKLGANAILAVSMAAKKLSAKIKKIPLYKNFLVKNNFRLPYPLMNIINGGAHANNGLRIQEFMIRPDKAKNFSEAMRICFIVISNLRNLIKKKGLSTSVGDEGGFAPMIDNNEQALDLVVAAIKKSGFKNGKDVSICLDVAANELFNKNKYSIHSKKYISVDQSIKGYQKIINKYKIKSIEDPFAENDWMSWNKIMRSTNKVQIVGDDLYVTNLERLKKGFLNNSSNSILIKLNQIGTVSETLEVIKFAQIIGYKTIISHRSGDSEDTFIADLAVGTDSNQIKTGSLARSERVAKYNQLIRIEEQLGKKARMNKIQ
ncbi:phosphopyruvate hydratase [Candidatus Pelagibacter sp.]|jgi:enolase|nr:phosphopyruvate hydratase [Candidatus Pelagibacter bacterium]MDB9808186.1 phosphopyruvate hydratase [Candidatus Pelagibacter sp.]MDC0364225.1 phosphopyruvate hydratase [Candidatus Pelagibacter sp.]